MESLKPKPSPAQGLRKSCAALHRDTNEQRLAEHVAALFHTVYCMVGNHEDAEDVLQDVYMKAHANLHAFRGEAALSTWLYRIAMNAARAHLRARSRGLRPVTGLSAEELDALARFTPDADSVERRFEQQETGRALRKALLNLAPEFREVFVLHQVEGKSYRDIAEILGIALGTVESRMYRAREKLRKELWPQM